MNENQDKPADAAALRRRAEERLRRRSSGGGAHGTEAEAARLVHELQVHQIELEMQNEELQQARARVEALVAQYTDLYDFAPTCYFSLDREGAIRQVNLNGARLLGVDRSHLVKRRFSTFVAETDRPAFSAFLHKVFSGPGKECCEVALAKEGLTTVRIEGVVSEDGQECRAVVLDLTEHRQAEERARAAQTATQSLLALSEQSRRALLSVLEDQKRAALALARQKDLYDVLSQSNKAIVHLVGRDELFAAICRIAVEHGRFRFAWIGLIDENDPRLKPVARYGEDAGYIDEMDVSGDAASDARRGLAGRILLSGTYVISNDFLNDPAMVPWHEAGRRAGVRAAAKFPIRQGGAVIGAISLYGGEPGYFTEDLVATLDEIAMDVSFALDNYAREVAHKQAEAALRAAEEQFRGLVEQSIAGIFIIQDGKLAYVNPRMAEIHGYASDQELIGTDPSSLVVEKDVAVAADIMRRLLDGSATDTDHALTARRKDGSTVELGLHSARASYRGRPAVIGMMQDISEKKRAEEQIRNYVAQLETAFMSTVGVATTLSEMRDPYTAGHERRVAHIAVAIGAELGFDARRQDGLRVAGHLHDIGKITIPSEILSKPGKLSPLEYKLIQGHPQASYDVLKDVEFPWPVAQVALQHHERIDGSGYPQGLKGEAILLEARIMAVADVVEAMSSHRPYRPGLGIEAALIEVERGRGTSYDPVVADACLKLFRDGGYAIPA